MVYLDPAGTQPPGPWVEVGTDHLPDVVLEVDYSTDVRRGKLGLYEAWGFREVWVEVPEGGSPRRRPGLTIHRRVGDGYRNRGGRERRPAGLDGGGDSRRPERAGAVGGDVRRAGTRRPRVGRRRRHRPGRRPVARRTAPRGACGRAFAGIRRKWRKDGPRLFAAFCGAEASPLPSAWPRGLHEKTPPHSRPRRWSVATRRTCWPAWKRGGAEAVPATACSQPRIGHPQGERVLAGGATADRPAQPDRNR